MNIVLVLIPLSLILLGAGVWAFFWGVNHAQFDDLETPALMPLSEDAPASSIKAEGDRGNSP
jgi:cbb3-type cytochrome oxidase maturation protein